MTSSPKTRSLADLTPDMANANRGTVRGKRALKSSLARLGAGRSVVIDRHGVVIAGNKSVAAARAAGFTDVIIVQTDGTQLVAVQRTDLDLAADPRARELAYADNRVAELDLAWDADQIARDMQSGLSISEDLWTADELTAYEPVAQSLEPQQYSSVVSYTIIFDDADQQSRFHAFLRMLARKHPEVETIGARLDMFLSTVSEEGF